MTQPNEDGTSVGEVLTAPVRMVTGLLPGADAGAAVVDAATAVRRWTSDRHNWIRVSWFVSGAVIVWVGIIVLARKPIAAAQSATGLTPKDIKSALVGGAKTAVTKGRA